MNATALQNPQDALLAWLHHLATHSDYQSAYQQYRSWLSQQRFTVEQISEARINYLLILLSQVMQDASKQSLLTNAIARLEYTDSERQLAMSRFNRQPTKTQPQPRQPQPPQQPRSKVAVPNPLDIGKMPAPSDRLSDETHQLGESIARVATQFKVPLTYQPDRSRKSIRVKRLFFKPTPETDLTKVGNLRSNFVGHAGMQPQASILVVPGGVEIHDPIPGDQWERPHFKRYVEKPKDPVIPEDGFSYTVGVDLDGKQLKKDNVIGMLISGYKGSGKSQHIKSMLCELCLCYEPRHLQLALFDVCGATFQDFAESPWLWQPPCLDPESYEAKMEKLLNEARDRERLFNKHNVPNIEAWNRKYPDNPMPRIVVAIEEFGETVMRVGYGKANKVPASLSRANRKQGFDIVLATQVPSKDDFDEDLLRNLGDRVVFYCSDIGASYIAFGYNDDAGTSLQKKGDGFLKNGTTPIRFQSLFLGDDGGQMLVKQIQGWGHSLYGSANFTTDAWDEIEQASEQEEQRESDPDWQRFLTILELEPQLESNEISETEFLWQSFRDKYPERTSVTGNSKNWCRNEVARIKEKFTDA